MMRERYCNASPKPEFFLFSHFVCIFIHISANMSPFALKFSQMILHTETSKLMCNRSFLFEVLHQPTLLPSTFKNWEEQFFDSDIIMPSIGSLTTKTAFKHSICARRIRLFSRQWPGQPYGLNGMNPSPPRVTFHVWTFLKFHWLCLVGKNIKLGWNMTKYIH